MENKLQGSKELGMFLKALDKKCEEWKEEKSLTPSKPSDLKPSDFTSLEPIDFTPLTKIRKE